MNSRTERVPPSKQVTEVLTQGVEGQERTDKILFIANHARGAQIAMTKLVGHAVQPPIIEWEVV